MNKVFSILIVMFVLRVTAEQASAQDVSLIVHKSYGEAGSDSNIVTISLDNEIPVRSLQFILSDLPNDLKMDTVLSTARTAKFIAVCNELADGSAKAIQISLSADRIEPGSGPIMRMYYSVTQDAQIGRHSLDLSDVTVADSTGINAVVVDLVNGHFDVLEASSVDIADHIPKNFELLEVFPNPFTPKTVISYHLQKPGQTRVSIYNTLGQLISILRDSWNRAGHYQLTWDGMDSAGTTVSPGIYFCVLETPNRVLSKRITFVR